MAGALQVTKFSCFFLFTKRRLLFYSLAGKLVSHPPPSAL